MANRLSRILVPVYAASYDGRFHGRYPLGNKPNVGADLAGNAAGRASSISALLSAIKLAATSNDAATVTAGVSTAIRLGASAADVASAVAGLAGGSVTDDAVVSIFGPGFGPAQGTQDFWGGLNNRIEQASDGANFSTLGYPGWAQQGNDPTKVTTARAYSRTKALRNVYRKSPEVYQFSLRRDYTSLQTLYTDHTLYLDNLGLTTSGQLKGTRVVGGGAGTSGLETDGRSPNTLAHKYWNGGNGTSIVTFLNGPSNDHDYSFSGQEYLLFNTWCRLQQHYVFGPKDGAGSYRWRATRLDTQAVIGSGFLASVPFWGGSDTEMRWLIDQWFIANALEEDGVAIYLDADHYIVANCGANPNFIRLGNAPTLAGCTEFSPCLYISWADDVITFKVNKGKLSTLSPCWAYPYAGIDNPISTTGYVPVAA
jgi:hypothetical protein